MQLTWRDSESNNWSETKIFKDDKLISQYNIKNTYEYEPFEDIIEDNNFHYYKVINYDFIGEGEYLADPILPVDGKFILPKLGFDYNALEPNIDAQTMEIHYSKHHQGYVNNLNKAIEGKALATYSLEKICSLADNKDMATRNNAGGHFNHTFFWEIIKPGGAKEPNGALAGAIVRDYFKF